MESLPPLNLTTGPAVSEATSGGGAVGTGEFNFKPQAGLIQSVTPLFLVGVVAWLALR